MLYSHVDAVVGVVGGVVGERHRRCAHHLAVVVPARAQHLGQDDGRRVSPEVHQVHWEGELQRTLLQVLRHLRQPESLVSLTLPGPRGADVLIAPDVTVHVRHQGGVPHQTIQLDDFSQSC